MGGRGLLKLGGGIVGMAGRGLFLFTIAPSCAD